MKSILLFLIILNPIVYAQVSEALVLISNDISVNIEWDPLEIKPNQLVTFELEFVKDGIPTPIYYDFIVEKDDIIIKEVKDSFASNGNAKHIVEFPSSGSFKVMIKMQDRDPLTFDLKVTPEFPLGSMIVIVTLVAITIVLARTINIKHN